MINGFFDKQSTVAPLFTGWGSATPPRWLDHVWFSLIIKVSLERIVNFAKFDFIYISLPQKHYRYETALIQYVSAMQIL